MCIREAVRLRGKGAGFVIWWSQVKSSIQLLTGFVLGFPKFNFTAALCSQLVCLLPVEIFKHFQLRLFELFVSLSFTFKALRGLQ